ncbi:MAG: orotidine-5'-phosphate decarboxylase [Opitutales bacterium]|nr:orotidine-5'-phosphate decarboxylase [Opitutales bacterium]
MSFYKKLEASWASSKSLVCVGLDPDLQRIRKCLPETDRPFEAFGMAIIDATAEHACAFKPQFAHYAAAGRLNELKTTIDYLRDRHPDKLIILDYKRGDIGSTAAYYAREGYEVYGADAVTLNPYMGGDTLEPFAAYEDKGAFVLCKTSNPGSDELQGLELASGGPLYLHVARRAAESWNACRNLGLVVGATYPEELAKVRAEAPDLPILVPGIGAQGGDLAATLAAGANAQGTGLLINSSRGILYAEEGPGFAAAAAKAAEALKLEIQACLQA